MSAIGKACDVIPGKTPAKAAYTSAGDVKIVKFRDVLETGRVDFGNDEDGWFDSRYADDSDLVDLPPKTILLTNAAHSIEHIGKKVAYVEDVPSIADKVCFVGELTSIRSKDETEFLTKWIFYWLQTNDAKSAIARAVEGAHLVPRQFKRIKLPDFSLDVQTEHLGLLDQADDAIQKARAELDATRELKRSLLSALFAEGVLQPKGLHHSKWITCPAHWDIKPLKRFAEITSGFTMGRDISQHETVSVPYVTVVNVQDGRFDLRTIGTIEIKKEELNTDLLRHGDILMTEGGDRDKLGRGGMWRGEISPCSYQNHIFRVRLDVAEYKPELFHFLIQTYQAKNYFYAHAKQTSNLCTINSRELKNWPVPIPPMDEQEKMIEVLQAAEVQENAIEKKVEALHELKRSLLQNLLTGQIRIPQGAIDA